MLVVRVTKKASLLQIYHKSFARDTVNSMHLHFSKKSLTFPVNSKSFNKCGENFA